MPNAKVLPRIVLASASARRLELLTASGFTVVRRQPNINESARVDEAPAQLALRLATDKARAVRAEPEEIVVAADTIVVVGALIFGKPADDADARHMLETLSGRQHEVLGGYCVRRGAAERAGVVVSKVTFRELGQDGISAYIRSREPRDKAGAYGIQGRGAALVEEVHGSFTNVVGLPLREVIAAILELAGS